MEKLTNLFLNHFDVIVEPTSHSGMFNITLDKLKFPNLTNDDYLWSKIIHTYLARGDWLLTIKVKGQFNIDFDEWVNLLKSFLEYNNKNVQLNDQIIILNFFNKGRENIFYNEQFLNFLKYSYFSYLKSLNLETSPEKENEQLDTLLTTKLVTEKNAIVKVRLVQGKFKNKLLRTYPNHCLICEMNIENLLIASHIKPWVQSDDDEKINPHNGFLLCPNHDALFDRNYITFEDNGEIIISKIIDKESYNLLGISEKIKVNILKENIKYLKLHRDKFYELEDER